MKQVEKQIPAAIQLIAAKLMTDPIRRSVPKVYQGYISAMGASIILSGLIPTLAFYDANTQDSDAEENRRYLLDILHELLKERYLLRNQSNLIEYALALEEQKRRNELRKLHRDVVNASIAVKLALRSFHLEK